jgi:subtilisin family serine protease
MRTESLPKDATTKISRAGAKILRALPDAGLALIGATDAQANKLAADPAFLAIGPEHYFTAADDEPTPAPAPSDGFLPLQWDMRRIGAPALWSRSIPANTIAVIDTGVMADHSEFAYTDTVVYGRTTSFCAGTAPGKPGGYPLYSGVADVSAWTDTGPTCWPIGAQVFPEPAFHGTHVAGTIAAPAQGLGTIGVSPTSKIAAYNVFDIITEDGGQSFFFGAFDFPIYEAIEDATNRNIKVINMSLGGVIDRSTREGNAAYLGWQRMTSRAFRRGTLIVAAAGNDNTNNNGSVAFIPSDLPGVMSVSSTGVSAWNGNPQIHFSEDGWIESIDEFNGATGSDVLAFYSNYGAAVDVAAPGGDFGPVFNPDSWDFWIHQVLSPCPQQYGWNEELDPWQWCWAMGTSMAAPHVAGVAGAVRALHPTWTPGQTRDWLKSTAMPVGDRQGFGAGIVNADLATR